MAMHYKIEHFVGNVDGRPSWRPHRFRYPTEARAERDLKWFRKEYPDQKFRKRKKS